MSRYGAHSTRKKKQNSQDAQRPSNGRADWFDRVERLLPLVSGFLLAVAAVLKALSSML